MAGASDKLSAELEKILLNRIAAGRLVLPPVAAANRCLAILRDPDYKTSKLVEQLETEPMLALRVMAEANSATFGGGMKISVLDGAINRIGATRLKTLLLEYAAEEVFRSPNRKIADANIKLWEHSIAVAILARDIAALINSPEGDSCYVAGLLHDIGKPVISATLLDIDRKTRAQQKWLDLPIWQEVVETCHRKVGVAVATEWKLPPEIVAGIRDSSDYDNANRSSIANIVRLANAVAKREGYITTKIDADDVEAMVMVGTSMLGADGAVLTRLGTTLRQRFPVGAQ